MTSKRAIRRGHAIAAVLAAVVSPFAVTNAQTPPQKFESFSGTTVNMSVGAGETLKINVFRWSSDEERDRLLSAFKEKGEKQLLEALQGAASAGYIWTSESLGYTLRYALRLPLPNGSERLIVATERRLGAWSGKPWTASGQRGPLDYPFTLIELRLNRRGEGEGKMSLTSTVAADQEGRTIALETYETSPVLLKGVKRAAR